MIDIDTYDINFIDIQQLQEFDLNGRPKIGIKLNPGPEWHNMQNKLSEIESFMSEFKAEEELRKTNPGLQKLWEQYKMMLILTK